MIVPPTTVIEPSQSIALRPATRGVLGVSISRRKRIMTKAKPSKGTRNTKSANMVSLPA